MFKFSYEWLKSESGIEVSYKELLDWLLSQGFEIESVEDCNDGDKVVEIEVKANRPDILCIAGVLREFYAGQKKREYKRFEPALKLEMSQDPNVLSHKIIIDSPDVHRYAAVEITGLDNSGKTPDYIVSRLRKMGAESISPLVDIGNYIMLLTGQPVHVFDADKIRGAIRIKNASSNFEFVTLAGGVLNVDKGALLISDDVKPLCLAGIIGARDVGVDSETRNIIIESANFDHIIERVTSKQTRVSTMASYRFERGVSIETAIPGALLTAENIQKICGGQIMPTMFVHNPSDVSPVVIELKRARVNSVLGLDMAQKDIAAMLEQCYFKTRRTSADTLAVTVPHFRLDVDSDVDLIEEVGRIYGYHNIEPCPLKLAVAYEENPVTQNADALRAAMIGYGFIEVLTYGFIPGKAMTTLELTPNAPVQYGDITIQNPLSGLYELMRPTLAYNIIATIAQNAALGQSDMKIFEIGRTFFRDKDADGFGERNSFAAAACGVKTVGGFGGKQSKFGAFDMSALLQNILREYNIEYTIKNTADIGFFERGIGARVLADGKEIGIIGKISDAVINKFAGGKLLKEPLFYCELCFDGLTPSRRSIAFESNFPSIRREYNFLVKAGLAFGDYKNEILSAPFVVSAEVLDVFNGKGVPDGYSSVLVGVEFNALSRTLETREAEDSEARFKDGLQQKFGITIKA